MTASGATVLTMRLPDRRRCRDAGRARPAALPAVRAVNAELDKVAAFGTVHSDASTTRSTTGGTGQWTGSASERGRRLIAYRFWDRLAIAGRAVAARADPERPQPGLLGATTYSGSPPRAPHWCLRRSIDLIPYLLFIAAREALIEPREWSRRGGGCRPIGPGGGQSATGRGRGAGEALERPTGRRGGGVCRGAGRRGRAYDGGAGGRAGGSEVAGGQSRALSSFSGFTLIAMNSGAGLERAGSAVAAGPGFRRRGASTVSMFGDQCSSVALPLTAVLVLHSGRPRWGYLTTLTWLPACVHAARRGLAGPAGQAQEGVSRRPGPGAVLATIRSAQPWTSELAQTVCGDVHRGRAVGTVHGVGRDAVRVDRAAGLLRRRAVADLRQPRVLFHGRPVGRRAAGGGADGAVRDRGGRAVVRRLSLPAGHDQPAEPPSSDGADGVTAGLRFVGPRRSSARR